MLITNNKLINPTVIWQQKLYENFKTVFSFLTNSCWWFWGKNNNHLGTLSTYIT